MKNIFLIFIFLWTISATNAQKVYAWMDAGVKVGYGLTGMINSNLFDDKLYEHHLSTGAGIGAKLGLYIGLYNGITVDFMLSNSKQKFDFLRDAKTYYHTIKWKTYDLALLYRNQKNGVYVELGPQFSFVNKVTQQDDYNPQLTDVKKYYAKNYISGIFGVGGYLLNYENFTTMLGIRLGYGFTDMISDEGKNFTPNAFPNPSASEHYDSYKKTNPAFVQLNMEFNFALGYYGRSSCSKRATLFSF